MQRRIIDTLALFFILGTIAVIFLIALEPH